MTFLLFAPASTKWLGWRKNRKSRRDRFSRPTYKAMEKRPGDEVEIMPKIMLAQPIKAYPGNEVCPTGGGGTNLRSDPILAALRSPVSAI